MQKHSKWYICKFAVGCSKRLLSFDGSVSIPIVDRN
jgi:hypothetical protein